ncbi:MAG TPA: type II toxin-antitoxin system VapC family toxin [Gemmataceae bacterium]|nr:type II toxin-antitoxin system VapC family toxin [Gemmataceae bacterium]
MAYLIDTSVLGRLANIADPQFPTADRAVTELRQRGEVLHITPQNLVEFRSAATRPQAMNGLGLSAAQALARATIFEAAFKLLPETDTIFPAWKALVDGLGIIGKQVHDARLVAVCHVNKVTHLLTFNVGHFARLAGFGPGIIVVDPSTV